MKRFWLLVPLCLTACVSNNNPQQGVIITREEQAERQAKVHTELAAMYFERSQMGVALGEIETALKSKPDYAPAFNVRALIQMALRDDKAAEADFLYSLKLNSKASETQNNYGWFLCQRNRAADSIPYFLAAIKNPLYETPELAYFNAGTCAKKAGLDRDAIEFFERAIQVRPDMFPALWSLVEIHLAKGDYRAAKKYFSEFIEQNDGVTAEQWMQGIRIARRLMDASNVEKYGAKLTKKFPESAEAKQFLQGE